MNPQQSDPAPQQPPIQPNVPQQASNGHYEVVPPPVPNTLRPSGHNPYEFIVAPNTAKASRWKLGGNKFWLQIGVLVGGVVVLMIIATVVLNALVPNKSSVTELTTIAEEQQELIRVATLGANQASGQSTKNFAITVQLGITSSQNDVLSYLASRGHKPTTKQLTLKRDAATDQLLTAATATSTFDTAVSNSLTEQLHTYQTSLQSTYKAAGSAAVKTLLQKNYNAATLLLQSVSTDTTD